jgi:hypothetical protein
MPDMENTSLPAGEPASPAPESNAEPIIQPLPKSPDALELNFDRQLPYILLAGFLLFAIAGPYILHLFTPSDDNHPARPNATGASQAESQKGDIENATAVEPLTTEDVEKFMQKRQEALKAELGEEEYNFREFLLGMGILACIAGSVTLFVIFTIGEFTKRPHIELLPPGEKLRSSYGLIACAKFIVILFFIAIVARYLLIGFVDRRDFPEEYGYYFDGGLKLAAVAVFMFILLLEYRVKPAEMGFNTRGVLRGIKGGALGYATFAALILGFTLGWDQLYNLFREDKEVNPLFGLFITKEGGETGAIQWRTAVAVFFAASFVAPIAEEFFFRGLLYTAIRDRFGFWFAAAVSSTLFGFIHAGIYNVPPIIFLGFVFAYIYERTRTLVAPIVAHAIYNTISLAVIFAG